MSRVRPDVACLVLSLSALLNGSVEAQSLVQEAVDQWKGETGVEVSSKVVDSVSRAVADISSGVSRGYVQIREPIPQYSVLVFPSIHSGTSGSVRVPDDSLIEKMSVTDLVRLYLYELKGKRWKSVHQTGTLSRASVSPYAFFASISLQSGEAGYIRVESIPAGIEFRVDGKRRGRTASLVVCSAGEHTIEVGKEGSEPYCKREVFCPSDEEVAYSCPET